MENKTEATSHGKATEKEDAQGKASPADLTNKEDLSIAVMNLVSLEEHLAMTSVKTGKVEYLHVLSAVRKLRIKLLKRLVKNTEGELWCISKHLLAASMRIMETATKYLESDPGAAHDLEKAAFDVYSLFWLLQEGIGPSETSSQPDQLLHPQRQTPPDPPPETRAPGMSRLKSAESSAGEAV